MVCPLAPVGSVGIIGVMIKVFILTSEALCVLSGLCCNADITVSWCTCLPCPPTHTRSQARGPASSPTARTPDGDLAGEDVLPLRLGLASQVCRGWVKWQGRLLCMVCVLKASVVKSWELVLGAPGRAGHGCTSRSLLVPKRHRYRDWCLSLRAETF